MDFEVFPRDEDTVALMFNINAAVCDLRECIIEFNENAEEFIPEQAIASLDILSGLRKAEVENLEFLRKAEKRTAASDHMLQQLFKIKTFDQFCTVLDHVSIKGDEKYKILRHNLMKTGEDIEEHIELYAPAQVYKEKIHGKNGLDLFSD